MKKDYYSNSQEYINRWIISYADLATMLLALFIVLYAVSQKGMNSSEQFKHSVKKVFEKQQTEELKEYLNNIDQNLSKDQNEFSLIENKIKTDFGKTNNISISRETRGLIIRLNDAVLFTPGSDTIKNDTRLTLDKLAELLKEIPNSIKIEGHTDNSPINSKKYSSNWVLSTTRATNIISYLISKHKFDPKRLSAVGYGEYVPLSENNTAKGRASNRRVDIVVLSSASELFNIKSAIHKNKLEK